MDRPVRGTGHRHVVVTVLTLLMAGLATSGLPTSSPVSEHQVLRLLACWS